MGCDIHLYVEKRADASSPWVTADSWKPDKYEPERTSVNYEDRLYNGRNYDLFAILANVRNGHGFVGVKTGEGFVPISEPRGVPDDCCVEYRSEVESWDADGHSHSHLTVVELLAYDWTQTTRHQGYVDLRNYGKWLVNGKPESWAGGVGGGAVKTFTSAEADAAVEKLGLKKYGIYHGDESSIDKLTRELCGVSGSPYVLVEWTEPYYASVDSFLSATMPRLWRLGSPENVRLVFFFDN